MVFIIAEIGTNHMGDINIAKKIIDVARSSGCDAVKFQKKDVTCQHRGNYLPTSQSLRREWSGNCGACNITQFSDA